MHMKLVHEGNKPFSCNICTKSFLENDHLNQYICQDSLEQNDTYNQNDQEISFFKSPDFEGTPKKIVDMTTPKLNIPKNSRVLFASGGRTHKA